MSRIIVISRRTRGFICFLLLSLAIVHPLGAQEERLNELSEQVDQLYKDGKYAEATPLAEEALRIAQATFEAQDPNISLSSYRLALLYDAQERYAVAGPLFQRALPLFEKVLGPENPRLALMLNQTARAYVAQSQYAAAEQLYKRALDIRAKALSPDAPEVAQSLGNLAALYYMEGRYSDAEPLYKRTMVILEKVLGTDHPDVGRLSDNLAMLYDEQGRYSEGETLHKRALAIAEKTSDSAPVGVATSLNNLAMMYARQGQFAAAEPFMKRALAIMEKVKGPEHADVATSLNNLAELYRMQGQLAPAEPLYNRALAIREKVLGPEHPDVADSLSSLALLFQAQGQYAAAEPLYQRALAIREKILGPEHPAVAETLDNLAVLRSSQGHYGTAEPLMKRALAIQEKALEPGHASTGHSLLNLAGLYYGWGQSREAQTFFDRAFANLASQFDQRFLYMSESDRLTFVQTVSNAFPGYFSFSITYNQQMPELAGKVYDLLLWEKGMVAARAAAERARIVASGDRPALDLLEKLAAKRDQFAALARKQPQGDPEKWRDYVQQIGEEAIQLERELVQRSTAFAGQEKLLRPSWLDVQKSLKADEAAVEFVRFNFYDGKHWEQSAVKSYHYLALVVRPDSVRPQFVVLGEAKELESDSLRDYRLRAGLSGSRAIRGVKIAGEETEKNAAQPKTSFYQAFWKPLEPALGDARRVYVSTDGVLNQVALGVVPDNGGKLLMEKYDLRIVSSTKDLLRDKRASTTNTAVVVGNPTFDLDEVQQRLAVQAADKTEQRGKSQKTVNVETAATAAPTPIAGSGQRSRDLRGGALAPLPGTQKEAESVSRLLEEQRWSVQLYTQQNALEERIKQVQSPRVLHLATHGFFESDQERKQKNLAQGLGEERASGLEDPMLRSGLYLTGANRTLEGRTTAADIDDGVLTAYEATQLNLQGTELVVLSACETGLGESQNGEGVFGLRRALQEAGAETVLMSMWSVPDQETQELMTLFYSKWLGGLDKHKALLQAQLEERETVRKRYGKDLPYYWGAFVLVGP